MDARRKAQIAQCCRGCPCKTAADCIGGADPQKVAGYIKGTARCHDCGEHDGLVVVVRVTTGAKRILCSLCVPYGDGRFRLA